MTATLLAQLDKVPVKVPDEARGLLSNPAVLGVAALLAVGLLLLAARKLFGRKRGPEDALRENLADYPPPPKPHPSKTLRFQGEAVRVRLVVVAPMGRTAVTADGVPELLDGVYRGLGAVAEYDKPRVRVWPTQLSAAGFAPTFQRLTAKPDPDGKPSRWILAAGPAKAGSRPILLAVALLADEPSRLGRVQLDVDQWPELFAIERG